MNYTKTLGNYFAFGFVALWLWGTIAEADESVPQYSIEQFLETTSFSGFSFSPDGSKLLISSDQTGIPNAYALEIESGELTPLTQSETDPISAIGFFPKDERFLYRSDQGGNELTHIYMQALDGSVRDLTPGEQLKARFTGWSDDDRYFYIATNERNPKFFDLYRYAVSDLSREMIYQNDEGVFPGPVSPDGTWVALNKVHNRNDSDVYLYNVNEKTSRRLTPHEGEVNFSAQEFTQDGKHLLMVTDDGSEFLYLIKQSLDSGDVETVYQTDWDVIDASFSKHGKYLTIGVNRDARAEFELFEAADMQPVQLPVPEGVSVGSLNFSDDESQLAFYATSGKMPRDLFHYDLKGSPRQLTQSLNAEIEPEHLVEGEVVRFTSFDGIEVPGILYKPHRASEAQKAPALVWVHGGPGGQSTVGYRALIQYLVNHGYVVYAINNRGSSGYGKTFQQLDDQKHGQGDLDDCVTSKQMLVDSGFVDPDRIGIIGGSYGGYMVCAALAFRPEEFEVGVNIFGVTNWVRTLASIPPWWEAQREALEQEMGDFDNVEYLTEISPLFHAERIQKPLMVLQGANDPRVLKVESDEIVEAVKQNGVPVRYELFEDEGHGFRKKKNQLRGYRAILDFCDEHLKTTKGS